jgi:hypothetical protein
MPDGWKLTFSPDASPVVRHRKSFRPDVLDNVYWLDFEGTTRH